MNKKETTRKGEEKEMQQNSKNNEINNIYSEIKNSIKINNQNNINYEDKQDFEEAILEAFREFDKDKSSYITKEEIGNFIRTLGYKVTEIELEEMINEIEEDGNGLISIKEFRNLLTKSIKDDFTINTSMEAFGIFDKFKTERINCDTLKDILLSNNGDAQFTQIEVEEMLGSLKKDENMDVNYRELVKSCFDIFNTEDAN
jgi:calmodulin